MMYVPGQKTVLPLHHARTLQGDCRRSINAKLHASASRSGCVCCGGVDWSAEEHECAAKHLCCCPGEHNLEYVLCINCNYYSAHEFCAKLLFFQTPLPDEFIIDAKDLGVGGKHTVKDVEQVSF